jgi:hypothetical protein
MARNTIKRALTQCGIWNRAKVIGRDGDKLTYRWPCGYERTEVFTQGVGRMKRPANAAIITMFARYWAQGVTYECPRCRRAALKAKQNNPPRPRGLGMTE